MKKFEDLGIRVSFVKGLAELGIIEPTDIQQKVIPLLLNDPKDIVAQAQTGTGKTAAYGLPLLEQIDADNSDVPGADEAPS